MTKQTDTKQAEPAIRELTAEELMQASGAGVVVNDLKGIVIHDIRKQGGDQQTY
jgi:hypothetical protein